MLHHQKSTSEDPLPSPTVNDTSKRSIFFKALFVPIWSVVHYYPVLVSVYTFRVLIVSHMTLVTFPYSQFENSIFELYQNFLRSTKRIGKDVTMTGI